MSGFIAQNGTLYAVWLATSGGTRLKLLDNFINLNCVLVANDLGYFEINLPSISDFTLIAKDRTISIWRKPVGGNMALYFRGYILRILEREEAGGQYKLTLSGPSISHLLQRRIVAYASGSANADRNAAADDEMKAYVKDNLGSSAVSGRDISADGFSVQANTTLGPTVQKAGSYQNLLNVLKDVSQSSRQSTPEIFFNIDPTSDSTYQFNTYKQQIGQDLRNRMIFSRELGNLGWAQFDQDWNDYGNAVYAGGQGDGLTREIVTATTSDASLSTIARTEIFKDARNEGLTTGVTAAANAALIGVRAVKHFTGQALSVPGSIYGLDWHFGDYVTASFRKRQFDCIIRAATIYLNQDGSETIDAMLESYA